MRRLIVCLATALLTLSFAGALCSCIGGCGSSRTATDARSSANKPAVVPKQVSQKPSAPVGVDVSGLLLAFRRNNQIWTAKGDGTGLKRLTVGFDASPAVSPDGKTIVYEHSEGNPEHSLYTNPVRPAPSVGIFSKPSAGGSPRLLTPSSWMTGSGWTPLFPLDNETKWVQRNCVQPSYSPDGKRICLLIRDVYYIEPSLGPEHYHGYQGIAVMNSDGTREPQVIFKNDLGDTGEQGSIGNPRFSSDGTHICVDYSPTGSFDWEVDEVPVAGGELTRVTPAWKLTKTVSGSRVLYQYPSFGVSPLPGRIAVLEDRVTEDIRSHTQYLDRIALMTLNDQRMREICANRSFDNQALPRIDYAPLSFTPSGKIIAFAGEEAPPSTQNWSSANIYFVSVAGGNPTKIITNGDQPCFGSHDHLRE